MESAKPLGRRSLDDALKLTGAFGNFHVALLILNICFNIFVPWISQAITFIGATPEYFCIPNTADNISHQCPHDDFGGTASPELLKCERFIDPTIQNETEGCSDGWWYSNETFGETIVTEFDLVCSNAGAPDFAQSSMMLGGAIGSVVAGLVADHIGRRPVIIVSFIIYVACGCGLIFVPNIALFITLFTIYGATQPAFWSNCHILFLEYLVPSKRSMLSSLPPFFQSLGSVSLGVLAYFIRDWRYLQAVLISPFLLLLLVVWLVPESARWHISKGKVHRSEKILKRIAVINRRDSQGPFLYDDGLSQDESHKPSISLADKHFVERSAQTLDENEYCDTTNAYRNRGFDVGEDVEEQIRFNSSVEQGNTMNHITQESTAHDLAGQEQNPKSGLTGETLNREGKVNISTISAMVDDEESKKGDTEKPRRRSLLDLFKPPVLYVTLAVCTIRVVYTTVYFGFVLNTGNLAGNPYLNFVYGGLVEIPARLIPVISIKKLGGRFIACIFFLLSAITLTVIALLPEETKNGKNLGTVITVLSLFGRFLVTVTNASCLLLPMELFPTTVRTIGTGLAQFFGRFGGFIAPLMLYLDTVFAGFSLIVMAVGSLTASILAFLLPESLSEPQPETPEDLKRLMAKKRRLLPRRNVKG